VNYHNLSLVCLLVGILSGTPSAAGLSGDEPDPGTEPIVLHRCKVGYIQSSMVGTPEWGVIQESFVGRGTVVKAGQVLAHLQDNEARAEVAQRAAESQSDVALRLSIVRHQLALSKYKMTYALRQRNAVSAEQLNVDKLEADQTVLAIEQEKERRTIAKLLYDTAEAKVRAKQIIAPHDGIVSEVFKKPGEAVQMGEQVYRMDNIGRLQVVGKLDVRDCGRIAVGATAQIRAEIGGADLPIEREILTGTVTFIDTKLDPATQTATVYVEGDNRVLRLSAGMEASLELEVQPNHQAAPAVQARLPETAQARPAWSGPRREAVRGRRSITIEAKRDTK